MSVWYVTNMTHFQRAFGIFSLWWPPQHLTKTLPSLLFAIEAVAVWREVLFLMSACTSNASSRVYYSFSFSLSALFCDFSESTSVLLSKINLILMSLNWTSTWEAFTDRRWTLHQYITHTHRSKLQTDSLEARHRGRHKEIRQTRLTINSTYDNKMI